MLKILMLFLSIADSITGMLRVDQLEDAGIAIANSRNLQRAVEAKRTADAARAAVTERLRLDPNWVPDNDPNAR